MKIYFAGSIRGGRDEVKTYRQIISLLAHYGTVLTEHIGDTNLTSEGEAYPADHIFTRDMRFIKDSDCLVAEVTVPSLGVGYEIAKAEEWGKKILCLYKETEGKKLSALIQGCSDSGLITLVTYKNTNELAQIIENFFNKNVP